MLRLGSIADQQSGELQLRNDVRRALVDRGRVWRNLQLADLGDGQVILNTASWTAGCIASTGAVDDEEDLQAVEDVPAEEGGAAAAPAPQPASLGLEADSIVYAFKETPLGAMEQLMPMLMGDTGLDDTESMKPCKVPTFYVGEFRVVGDPNAPGGALTLVPTIPLTDQQIERLEDPNQSWALYEIMPVDAHRAFEGLTAEQLASLIQPESMEPAEYQALLAEYGRDQGTATDVDPPDRKWVKVRFKQAHTEDVDVQVEGQGTEPMPLADSLFDPSGRSMVATLSQGGQTKFEEGDEAIFDWATGRELESAGKVEVIETIYHRRLRDYARLFRTYTAELAGLDRSIELAQADLDKLAQSITDLQAQVAFQSNQRDQLEHDLNGLNREREVLVAYGQKLDTKWNELRESLSQLYRSNRQLVSQMAGN
jgi:hypothetical protein